MDPQWLNLSIQPIMAVAEKIDVNPEEAARSLGAPNWAITKDILFAAG